MGSKLIVPYRLYTNKGDDDAHSVPFHVQEAKVTVVYDTKNETRWMSFALDAPVNLYMCPGVVELSISSLITLMLAVMPGFAPSCATICSSLHDGLLIVIPAEPEPID